MLYVRYDKKSVLEEQMPECNVGGDASRSRNGACFVLKGMQCGEMVKWLCTRQASNNWVPHRKRVTKKSSAKCVSCPAYVQWAYVPGCEACDTSIQLIISWGIEEEYRLTHQPTFVEIMLYRETNPMFIHTVIVGKQACAPVCLIYTDWPCMSVASGSWWLKVEAACGLGSFVPEYDISTNIFSYLPPSQLVFLCIIIDQKGLQCAWSG